MKKLKDIYEIIRVPLRVALIAGIVMLSISITFISNATNNLEKTETTRSVVFAQHLLSHLQLVTIQAETGTNAIALKVLANGGNFSSKVDQAFADGIMKSMPNWHNISVSPNDCIKLVSPIKGNEGALNYCLNSNATEWKDISQVVKANRVRILGPYQLAQGGTGFIMHRPVYLANGEYWGLVSAVSLTSQIMEPLIQAGREEDMLFSISISDNSQANPRIMHSDLSGKRPYMTTEQFQVGENTFEISAAPKYVDLSTVETLQRRMAVFSAAIVAANFLLTLLVGRQRETSRKLEQISKFSPSVLFQMRVLRDGQVTFDYISDNCKNLFGFAAEDLTEDPNPLLKLFKAEDIKRALTRLNSAKSPGEVWSQRMALVAPHKGHSWIQVDATYERISGGKYSWNGVFLDATAVVDKEIANDLTAQAFDILEEGVVVFDPNWKIVNANRAMVTLTGFPLSFSIGRHIDDFVGGLNDADFTAQIEEGLRKKGVWRGQTYFRNSDGSVNRDFVTFSAIKNNAGDLVEIIAVLNSTQDILIDQTTGLANRKLFAENLTAAIDSAKDSNRRVALLHVGIHGIGAINDTFGHIIGDRMLREIANKLLPFATSGKTVGRLGDSEFGLFREMLNEVEDIDALAKSILAQLSQPFVYEDTKVLVDVSIGISIFPDDASNMQELRSHADQSYKSTLSMGEKKIGYFSSAYEEGAKVRSYLTSYLTEALQNKALEFYYQPIVRIADRRLTKAEVLARWFDDDLGEVSPGRFIPIAEKSNLINQLGVQLLENTLEISQAFSKNGKEVQLSINVSPVEFMSENFVEDRTAIFAKYPQVNKKNIVFELTEGSLLSNKTLVEERIQAFREQGVGFAIDDFGTGYSSLSYLQELKVDFVKIDKSFVDRIETAEGLALCKSIVDLAHALELEVIAEGVETEDQFKALEKISCDYAQGYLFSKPVAKKSFLKMIK